MLGLVIFYGLSLPDMNVYVVLTELSCYGAIVMCWLGAFEFLRRRLD